MKWLLVLCLFLTPTAALAAGGDYDWCEKVESCLGERECWPQPWRFYLCKPGTTKPATESARYVHICVDDGEGQWSYRRTKGLRAAQGAFEIWHLNSLVCR
jgi:hypothetical protein